MRKLLLVTFILAFFSSYTLNAQHSIMFSNNYHPYSYVDEEGELVGFNVDILKAIAAIYNADVTIEAGSWEEMNAAFDERKVQAIGGAHHPHYPSQEYLYTRATTNTSHCFLYHSGRIKNFSMEKFRTANQPVVALWNNDVLIHYVLSINPTAKLLFINNTKGLVEALDRSDVTCIFGQKVRCLYFVDLMDKDDIIALDNSLLERLMGFKVSKENPELAEMLNNGLEVILANGEYERIYNKWIGRLVDKQTPFWRYLRYVIVVGSIVLFVVLLLIVSNALLRASVRKKTAHLQKELILKSELLIELENQKRKAEESEKMKAAFLANMSHEIRTPMNGILGFTDLLKSENLSGEEQKQFIEIIEQSGNRMLETINNIVAVSKLESGLESPRIKKVDIKAIVNELHLFFKQEAANKGITLVVTENEYQEGVAFLTDEYKVNSILTNLIKNALKFTKEGGVEVQYSVNNAGASFSVIDSGIGIKTEKQADIFNQFVQADYTHTSEHEGSGLGLTISKGYVDLLGGNISFESTLGKGTSFSVTIPNKD